MFDIRAVPRNGETRLLLSGEVDVSSAEALADTVERHLQPGASVVIDLGGVDFLDSQGIRAIVRAHHAAERLGARLVLGPASEPVERVLSLTRLRDHIPSEG